MIRVQTADVVRINTAMTIEGGAVIRFNSIGTANSFINRNGGEILDQPKPKKRGRRNVNDVDDSANVATGSKSGDGGKGEAKTSPGAG